MGSIELSTCRSCRCVEHKLGDDLCAMRLPRPHRRPVGGADHIVPGCGQATCLEDASRGHRSCLDPWFLVRESYFRLFGSNEFSEFERRSKKRSSQSFPRLSTSVWAKGARLECRTLPQLLSAEGLHCGSLAMQLHCQWT